MKAKSSWKRILRILLWVVTAVFLIILIILAPTINDYLRIMSAHSAKVTCSERYIAGRAFHDIIATDINEREVLGIPALRMVRVSENSEAQSIQTSLLGTPLYRDEAVFREGFGCVLVDDQSYEQLRASVAPARQDREDAGIWPLGDDVESVDNPQLDAALEAAFFDSRTGDSIGTRAVVVVHDGKIVGERYAQGFDSETPLIGWSMSKTVTAALAGIMLEETELTLDSTQLFPDWQDERANIPVRDLLSMSDGLDFENGTAQPSDELRQLYFTDNTVDYALEKPAAFPTNEQFNYSNGSVSLVIGLIRAQVEGETAWVNYPYEKLFDPIGMKTVVFETDAAGNFVGSSLVYASARDWARFGLLLLEDGNWFGEQVLPEGWADYMATPNSTTNGGWYGNGFTWLGEQAWNMGVDIPADDYWLSGFDGQFVIIIPSEELVIVRMGFTPN
ncbi:MAG: serine hydrolase, partial [Chloroflexota bacterium]